MKALGLSKQDTTYKKELDQEKQKLAGDDVKNPRASAAGDIAGMGAMVVAPEIPAVGAALGGALKGGETASKMPYYTSLVKKAMGLREEPSDDGWYAHNEIHGSKGVSKEDWKKGVRMNSKGEKVQTKMKNEEAEQIDEISKRVKSAYLGTAVADLTARSQEHGYNVGKKKKDLGDNPRKISNRQDGIYRATKGMREELDSSEKTDDTDDHFEKQSKKMQDAINLHLRKGKSYTDAVKAAKVHVKEDQELAEKTLTPAEMKKREEIANAIERKTPGMGMSKKMAIATAAAKRVAEQVEIEEAGMPASVIKNKQDIANMSDDEFAKKHGNKSEKELRDMAARHGYGWNKTTKTGSDHYVKRLAAGLKEQVEIDEAKRGRPSKTNPEQNVEPIQTQLSKMHKQNEVDVTFADKSTHTIPRGHANKALKHLSALKPIHRADVQQHMASSKQGFYDALAGKKPEAKPKITLAKLGAMRTSKAISSSVSDEAREKKAGGGDD